MLRRHQLAVKEDEETIMVRLTHMSMLMVALAIGPAIQATAQQPTVAPGQTAPGVAASTEPNPLAGLPRPPDQPASLLQAAPTGQVYGCPQLECPYFQKDPRLDPAGSPQPGWLFDVDVGVIASSVLERLGQTDPPGQITVAVPGTGHANDVVTVPMARLDWTVSPRFELGKRLPDAFGELDVAYRFALAEGSGSTAGWETDPATTAALKSHLNLQLVDLDYGSHETSLGPDWGMKWRVGLRYADVFFDSQADEPLSQATSGIFEHGISDNFWGIGPHATLELRKQRNCWGLGFVGRLDLALLFGEVEQRFAETSTTSGPNGPLSGETHFTNGQQVPILSGFLGFDWQPPSHPNWDILLGYNAEYWWNVGRLSDPDFYNGQSAGEVGLHGPVLRLEHNY
jgi:hypothetical protein